MEKQNIEQFQLKRPDIDLAAYRLLHPSPKAIVFIAHGMAEYALRYEPFARYLHQEGYSIYMHDHRGHGHTPGIKCYFADRDGWNACIEDLSAHLAQIRGEHPNTPVFLFAHSMGSFMAQEFMIRHSQDIDGVILSGSNGKPPPIAKVGKLIAKIEAKIRGPKGIATFSDKISSMEFNKRFQPIRTPQDWLSRDQAQVDAFLADPLCGAPCTTQLWLDLLNGIDEINKPERQKQIRSDLPVFIFSGTMCPVGLHGKGIRNLINAYTEAGLYRITYTLYPDGRHEMLNEINKDEVFQDITQWLDSVIN